MRTVPVAQCIGMLVTALSFISSKDLANLVLGFALLVIPVLLVKELSGSRR